MVAVNPEILKWARETAALSMEEAARKLGFRDSKTNTAVEKLQRLESGVKKPSRAQLNKMSKAYYQPLLVFYLSQPPERDDRGEDFRTLPQRTIDRIGNARLDLLMRDVTAAQSLVRDLLEVEDANPLHFVNSATASQGFHNVSQDIILTLSFDIEEFRERRNARDAFVYLRQRIESQGIFVLLKSDLGSHHTAIPVEVFRGFAVADHIAPFIVINRRDAVSAWSFTALHEVAHLWLGESGVSGAWGEMQTEVFCNRVAGTILLLPNELSKSEFDFQNGFDSAVDQIGRFAKMRNVSRSMVAYNLMLDEKIDRNLWFKLQSRFKADRMQHKEQERQTNRSRSGGPSYYAVRRSYLGPALIGLAKQHVDTGQLTPSKASVILGVKPINVYPLLNPDYFKSRN